MSSRSSNDESDSEEEEEEKERETNPTIKFRVIASGRMRSCVRVNDSDVAVGPPDAAQNDSNSPSWVADMPLPRVVAEKVTGAPIDHEQWQAVATQAFANKNGGFLNGFDRRSNVLLNSEQDEGAKFQWDVKLTRNIAPSSDVNNKNATIMKYKTAKKSLDILWSMLRNQGGGVAEDVGDTVETDWFLLKPRDLATWLGKHIMQEPTQSVRQLRSCRSHSPVRRRGAFFPPAAPGQPPPPPPPQPTEDAKRQLAYLMRKSKIVGDMLYSDAVLRSLTDAGRSLPSNTNTWWAPRWLRFPIVRGRHDVVKDARGNSVGEQFIIQLFNSAQSANALFPRNPALVSPVVFGMPSAVEEGGVQVAGPSPSEAADEGGEQGLAEPEAPISEEYYEANGDNYGGEEVSPVDFWTQQVGDAVATYNATSLFELQMEPSSQGLEFPLTPEEFRLVCDGERSGSLSPKRLTYVQAKEVWDDKSTYVLQKRDMILLKFYTKKLTRRLVGYVLLSPLDLDICTVALVCSSSVLSQWKLPDLKQMFKKFKPKQPVPADEDTLKLQLMLYFLEKLGVVVPSNMRTLDQVSEQLNDAVQNQLMSFKSLYPFVYMETTLDNKPLSPATVDFVNAFNNVLQQENNAIMEVHAACGTRVGDIKVGEVMMNAVVSVCSSLNCRFVCMNLDTETQVNHKLLNDLKYKQGILNGYETYIRDGKFVQMFLRRTQHRLGKYAFTFVPAKKQGVK